MSRAKLPLVGLTEIAQRAGVQKSAVAMWRVRHESFPDTVADLRGGPVFWWPDVKRWLKATNRRYDANLTVVDVNRYDKRKFPQGVVTDERHGAEASDRNDRAHGRDSAAG